MGKCEDLGGWSAGFFSDKLRISGAEEMTGSKERVLDAESVELLAVLEVFGVENMAVGFQGSGYNQGVVPGKGVAPGQMKSLPVKHVRRLNGQEWTKSHGQELLGLGRGHARVEATEGEAQKLLHDLKADDALVAGQGMTDQGAGAPLFFRRKLVEHIGEDIGVEEKPIAHSSLRACKVRWI